MANNEYVNKVEFGDTTVIDISDTTAEAGDVVVGKTFYAKSGAPTTGSLSDATQSTHGLMSTTDKIKLDGISTMTGADGTNNGTSGLVPAPSADAQYYLKFLCSDGTWQTVNATAWSGMIASPSSSLTSLTSAQILARQNSVYTTIQFLSANATPTAYNLAMYDANAYLNSTTALSTDNSTKVATTAFVKSVLPSTMTGATSLVAGTSGLVPAPTTSDTTKFLCGDGSWTSLPVMTGATSSVAGSGGLVPAPATTDVDKFLAGDGTYKSGGLPMVILSYGSSTWAQFEAAYNNNVIVYARASSNSNPASGSQTRMAFMAYVNNATTPTEVEFQYYRSMSSHSATAMGDQVFVYKLNKTNGWSVTTRDASIKQITGSGITVAWSSNKVTLTNDVTVSDSLSNTSTTAALSAAKGKELADNKITNGNSLKNNNNINLINKCTNIDNPTAGTTVNYDTTGAAVVFQTFVAASVSGTTPFGDGFVVSYIWRYGTGNEYIHQVAFEDDSTPIWTRAMNKGTWGAWKQICT